MTTVGKPMPCAGYPSQTAAVEAMVDLGMARKVIAKRTGLKLGRVDTLMSLYRTRLATQAAEAATWPPEKLEKAYRLFDATMERIAEALDVPVGALLAKVWLKGRAAASAAATEPAPEPTRDDDEAELTALQASTDADNEEQEQLELGNAEQASRHGFTAEAATSDAGPLGAPSACMGGEIDRQLIFVPAQDGRGTHRDKPEAAPVASVDAEVSDGPQHDREVANNVETAGETASPSSPLGAPIYRLKRRGEYLDKSGVGTTRNLRRAWQGTAQQAEAVYRRRPEYLDFDVERVYG